MIRREAVREYAAGALWVRPSAAALVALIAGAVLSHVTVPPDSVLAPLSFQGTADDARTLLIGVTGTVVTVIALVLGLTVVALQLSSTQFSPRLLRNFLRDRPNQAVLSVFTATFAYSAAGLYTVGVSSGERTEVFPRLAVSGSIVLLFASLGMVVYFADHLAHSIQIDAIMRQVEQSTLAVVHELPPGDDVALPDPPPWAVPVLAARSGYVQTVHPELALPLARRLRLGVRLRPRVGEHVVRGTVLAWVWTPSPEDVPPDPQVCGRTLGAVVRLGFERTIEQDAGLGIRQLADIACKALSPAVNDPYTAVQALDHLSVILCELARRPLGPHALPVEGTGTTIVVPAARFETYLRTPCGLIRRYGAGEPTVAVALLRLLSLCGASATAAGRPELWAAIDREAALVLADAEREVGQEADLVIVRERAAALRRTAAALVPE